MIVCKVNSANSTKESRELEGMQVIGAFTRTFWKDGGVYHGDNDTCLFSVYPKFRTFRSVNVNSALSNYQYLNAGGLNRGIGFGGKPGEFRFWIDSEGKNGYVRTSDSTFEEGELLPKNITPFRVDVLEVWGLGPRLTLYEHSEKVVMRGSNVFKWQNSPSLVKVEQPVRALPPVQNNDDLRKSFTLPSMPFTGTPVDSIPDVMISSP